MRYREARTSDNFVNLLENPVELVAFARSRKQRFESAQFRKYASHGPNVNGSCIRAAQENFWCAIPLRHHLRATSIFNDLSLSISMISFRRTYHRSQSHFEVVRLCQAKIGDLYSPFSGYQEILRLQVPVYDPMAV